MCMILGSRIVSDSKMFFFRAQIGKTLIVPVMYGSPD